MAHKKAGSSSKNGRDSVGQRLGVKVGDGQLVNAGSILVRQRGMTFLAGTGTELGHDYTVFATTPGTGHSSTIRQAQEAQPHQPRPGAVHHGASGTADDRGRHTSRRSAEEIHVKKSIPVLPGRPLRLVRHEFTVGSTRPELRVDVCSNCHPFYTGKQTIIDTAGQVERFQKRLERRSRHPDSALVGLTPADPVRLD